MADKIILFYAARHGTTALNAEDRFRGKNDVELDVEGKRDARRLAKYFEPIELAHLVGSDRKRTRQTAEEIAKTTGLKPYFTENLRAWNVGDFSGQKKTPETLKQFQNYIKNPDLEVPNGESLNAFKRRIRPCFSEAIDLANDAGEPILMVVHSSVVHEVGSYLYDDHEATLVEPGGVVAVYAKDGVLGAEPIFKARLEPSGSRGDTIS